MEDFETIYPFLSSDEEMENAILKSVSYAKKPNPEGLKLQKQFTYEKTVETILCAISSQM